MPYKDGCNVMVILAMEKRKVFEQGTSLGIVIPAAMIEQMKIDKGEELTLTLEEKSKGKFISVYKS